MAPGIQFPQSAAQYGHCGAACIQGRLVGRRIDAVGAPADHRHLPEGRRPGKPGGHGQTVIRGLPGPYHRHTGRLVRQGALYIEHWWRSGQLVHQNRVVRIPPADHPGLVMLTPVPDPFRQISPVGRLPDLVQSRAPKPRLLQFPCPRLPGFFQRPEGLPEQRYPLRGLVAQQICQGCTIHIFHRLTSLAAYNRSFLRLQTSISIHGNCLKNQEGLLHVV